MNGFLKCFRKEAVIVNDSKDSTKIFTGDDSSKHFQNDSNFEYSWYPPISQGKLIDVVRSTIPQLSPDIRKGHFGRIGIIGGSKEYTGAPYFAGISSLKVGADLCHVFCTPEAAGPIKTYSPELIVHPLFPSSDGVSKEECNKSINLIRPWLEKMDVIVIGCGLGREKEIAFITAELIKICRCLSIPIIVDADGLFVISQQPELISGYKHCILTPNLNEFYRLEKSVKNKESSDINTKHSSNNSINQLSTDVVFSKTSFSHIETSNNISKVNPIADSSINIPRVLPLGVDEERLPESLSPCERVPKTEWPSITEDSELQIHEDGEEINLFHQTDRLVKKNIGSNNTRTISSSPLNMCFYEHVLNENCIGVSKSNKKCDSNASDDSQNKVNQEFLLTTDRVFELSKSLGNICIVLKDKIDIITNGNVVAVCNIAGSYKRSGGQGDILSGVISTLFYWSLKNFTLNCDKQIFDYPEVSSAFGSCLIVRLSAYIAFKRKFRSMLASDLIENIPYVFESIFETNKHDFTEESSLLLLFNESQSQTGDE